jgi:hypothetical protein
MDLDPPPAAPESMLDAVREMPRIIHDLADGDLNEEEAAAIATWLVAAGDAEPPAGVVDRAVSIAEPACQAKAG